MDSHLIGELRSSCARILYLGNILVLKTASRGDHASHSLILFKEDFLRVQSGLSGFCGLLFARDLHLKNQFLESLFRLGIGHQQSLAIHLIAQRAKEKFLVDFRIHILNGTAHIHSEGIAVTVLRRHQSVFFNGNCSRIR